MAHLLLIDDDPALMPGRSPGISRPQHRVEVATTGAEGLDQVIAESPDVILLDLRLPDQSGPGGLQADPPRRCTHPCDLHHDRQGGGRRDRSDKGGCLRLPLQAVRPGKIAAGGRRGPGGVPTNARHRP